MKIKRGERLSGEYRKAVYEIITKKLKNPLISEMFSVTDVEATDDLSYAKVYISVFSGSAEAKEQTFKAIESSAKRIRQELSKMMTSRTVPELKFYKDNSLEYGDKMEKIFSEIRKNEEKSNG